MSEAVRIILSKQLLSIPGSHLLAFLVLLFFNPFFSPFLHAGVGSKAIVLKIKGPISPAVSDYITRGMAQGIANKAALVIIQMDTPGGLDSSMRDIIQSILSSPIPVVTYVAPKGARAASAGTYILYASQVAAMAPATNLGAATPITIGGLPSASKQNDKQKDELAADDVSPHKQKIINDAAAYIRALADRNGRNADWAELAVREAASLPATQALKLQVIDFVATDLNDLLAQMNGYTVKLASGTQVINTKNITISRMVPSWRYKLLSIISDPNIAYFLLLLGFYGLIFELAHPGVFLPGVAGSISLLLALYSFQLLPINYSGLALIILGMAFLFSELFIPSFGSLGIGGLVAMAVGSLILIDDESLKISIATIIGTTVLSAIIVLMLGTRVLSIRKKKIRTGAEAIIGMTGEAAETFDGKGRVWLLGELWLARSTSNIAKGEKVRITSRNGLELTVKSLKEDF